MDLDTAAREWQAHGYAILPGFISAQELRPALDELPAMYPTAEGFHDGTDGRRDRFTADEWAGIDSFPFPSAELSLLAVSDRVIDLAAALLGDGDLRIYSAEAWAKYTGAANYDQHMHRDYLNHTLMAPTGDPRFRQLEMFVYLVDVPAELGPPSLLSRTRTPTLPAKPNWYPRTDGADPEGGWVAATGSPGLYDSEVRAAGPAGTVVAWSPDTFHRGTALTLPRGPATRSTSATGRPAWSGASGCPGSAAAMSRRGTDSWTGRRHVNWRCSASRRPATRTGQKPPSPPRRNVTRA